MKKSTKIAIFVISTITLTGTVFAFNKHHHGDVGEHAEYVTEKISKKLKLDGSQKGQLILLKDEIIKTHARARKAKPMLRDDLIQLLEQDTLDRDKILLHITQKTGAVREHAPAMVNALADFYDGLNPEQKDLIRNKLSKKLKHLEDHHHG